MMMPKERLEKIINGEAADRAACICPGGMMNMGTAVRCETRKAPGIQKKKNTGDRI